MTKQTVILTLEQQLAELKELDKKWNKRDIIALVGGSAIGYILAQILLHWIIL